MLRKDMSMTKVIELTDEEYRILKDAAERGNETPEQFIGRMVRALAGAAGPIYYSTDEMFEALDAYAAEADAGRTHADE
jgi:hypothetical protein